MDLHARIYVAGAGVPGAGTPGTMIGQALARRLTGLGYTNLAGLEHEPDLLDRAAVNGFFERTRPEFVFVTAGHSAGIAGNERHPADLMIDNLLIAAHVIPAASGNGCRKLLYLSSSCTYPKTAAHPLAPSSLWTGPLEPTSAAYAVSKLAGVALCDAHRRQHGSAFISAIGADAYGPGDDFSPEHSHVVGALLRRMHEARIAGSPSITVWGSGTPRREFIYVDDLADACICAMRHYDEAAPINLGTGLSTSIGDLAALVKEVTGYAGELTFDRSKPDGMPFKGLDSSRLRALGWRPQVDLKAGLARTYDAFLSSKH